MGGNNMRDHRLTVSALLLAGLASSIGGTSLAAGPAAPANKPATLEPIPGSDLKRVVLTPKAAERLAIQTTVVREEPVMRWLTVEGEVEPLADEPTVVTAAAPTVTGATSASDAVPVRVRVPLLDDPGQKIGRAIPTLSLPASTQDDDDDDEQDKNKTAGKPAAVLIVPQSGERGVRRLRVRPLEVAPGTDASGLTQASYYLVSRNKLNLRPGQNVFVRVPQPTSGTLQKVIPHSAAVYDAHGQAWTYTNPEPLVFVRHRIDVEYVDGTLAVLKEGPPAGTRVVTAGAAELLGVEQKFGH
jgi:hypothetical protein